MVREACGVEFEVVVEPGIIEINHDRWHGKSAEQLEGEDAAAAAAYRGGSFFSTPGPPLGESNLEMMARCRAWLNSLNEEHAGKVVVAFGHGASWVPRPSATPSVAAIPPHQIDPSAAPLKIGTFQNGVEALLLSRGEGVEPRVVFTRKHGESHLKRGFPHDVYTR